MYENTARVRDVMAARRAAFRDRSKRSRYKQSVADLEARYATIRDKLEKLPDHLPEEQSSLNADDLWFFLKIEQFVKAHLEHEGRVYQNTELYTKADDLYKKLKRKKRDSKQAARRKRRAAFLYKKSGEVSSTRPNK